MERENSQKVIVGVVAGVAAAATASLVRSLSRTMSGDGAAKTQHNSEKDAMPVTDSLITDDDDILVAVEAELPLQSVELAVSAVKDMDELCDMYVVGGCDALGNWETGNAVKMERGARMGTFSCNIHMPIDFHGVVEFKFLKRSPGGETDWEQGPNRAFAVDGEGTHVESNVQF